MVIHRWLETKTTQRKGKQMNTKEYNGWTNYETWLIKLWQDNSEGEQSFWRETAEECVKVDGREDAVRSLSDIMKEHYETASEGIVGNVGFWTDLIGAALCEVNWREISEHWIDEVPITVTA